MNRSILFVSFLLASFSLARAQMWNGTDTLYGNEWIRYGRQYYKIPVAEDGIYRIPYETLAAGGLPVGDIDGSRYQLWHLGEEQPLYVSAAGPLAPGGFIEFYGQKNRSELDRHLFRDPDNEMLNPWYSLITDTAAYFLTWAEAGEPALRYEKVENELVDLPGREEWVWGHNEFFFTDRAAKQYVLIVQNLGNGQTTSVDIYRSRFEDEGFASALEVSRSFSVSCPAVYASGPAAQLELRMVSNDNTAGHSLEVRVDGELLAAEQFSGAALRKYEFQRPAASLGVAVNIEIKGLNNNDRYAIGGARLRYPRLPALGGASFASFALPAGNGARYLELEGLGGGAPAVLIDRSNGQRLEMASDGALWKAKLPAAPGERQLAVARVFNTVSILQPVTFVNYQNTGAEFLIISNEQLYDDGQGNNYVQEYADYRRSEAGGGYSVAIVEARQLYEQFAYGLNRHPLSIRNFAHYAAKHWPGLRYCFIIGKGQEYQAVRTAAALAPATAEGRMLVPSFGFPASDNLLLSTNTSSVPVVPVGRLAATGGRQVKIYLDKVQAMEANRDNPQTIADRAWMKQVIHLGGGSSANEQASIRSSLETMGSELANNAFGASVRGFYKTSTDPIQTSLSEQIFNAINQGSSLITFMGHSSPGTFDFNIDNPDNYSNYAKYPLMLSLGCYSGNIFTSGESIGERFTFYENRAAVAFGASRGIGFLSSLGAFAHSYYAHLGGDYYGQGIGDALRATLSEYDQNPFIGTSTLVEQFTLHGDPAIRLHPAPGPDFVVDPASVKFEPRVVTAQQDSFSLAFDAVNLGRNDTDTFTVEIRRQFPGGNTIEVIRDTVAAPAFRTTYAYRIPVRSKESVGLNTFFIRLDADNDVAELPTPAAELNNELKRTNGEPGAALFIVDNTARPVYPPDFALVGETPVTLKASTTDALAPERTYILEIDTTALFDSPMKQRTAITQRGGVIKWPPALPWQDSTAYFWRISPDSTEAQVGYTWEGSSFTYIEGSPEGWGQGGYWQWLGGEGENMRLDPEERKFTFAEDFTDFRVRNKVYESSFPPEGYINGVRWSDFFRWEASQSVNITVFDTLGRIIWNDRPGQYGSLNVTASTIACFPFPVENTGQRQNIVTFLDSIVPAGALVFLYTAIRNPSLDLNVQEWAMDSVSSGGRNIFNVLESEGAGLIRSLEQQMVPYLICYRKGEGVLYEEKASSINDVIIFEYAIRGFWDEGRYKSPIVGPSKNWESAFWGYTLGNENDTLFLSLIGLDAEGNESIIMDEVRATEINLSDIDAAEFPYLQFQLYAKDEAETTAPQLDFWRVWYQGVPDLAISPSVLYRLEHDSIQQGQEFSLNVAIENVSRYDSDSLLVKFVLSGDNNNESSFYYRYGPLEKNDTLIASLNLESKRLAGLQKLLMEVNPGMDQLEQYSFNNFFIDQFFVEKDKHNPILDVTFDGIHIVDGDLVSSKPEIVIRLKDENPYLSLLDTNSIRVFINHPEGNTYPVVIDGGNAVFYPASSAGNNLAQLEYRPSFEESGIYELVVRARDATGNAAGGLDYKISFEVITERLISNVLNYPNPFSTSTHFVYTLTGDTPPAEFKIQIMTVSGRVVREITDDEIGPLRVGTHRTDFTWDGRDDYGGQLANGVYLYKIYAKDVDGKDFESYDNGTSRYFKNGIGKLVILR